MIQSDNKNNLFDLTDYAISSEIVKDFPKVLYIFNSVLKLLYPYMHYAGVSMVVSAIEDSKVLVETQLKDYKRIHERKGRMPNE